MSRVPSVAKISILIILLVLIADQVLKIWVKTNMTLGQPIPVFGQWFIIKFIENPGMAFGIDIPGRFGKMALTLFRMVAAIAIIWYMHSLTKKGAHKGLIICLSLVLAGAIGNIIDSAIYGLIFSESTFYAPAVAFPEGGGYAPALHGKVVDMFYFPIIQSSYPAWVPLVGGDEFIFFRPIFNLADSSISLGVILLLIFQKRFFAEAEKPESVE